MSSSISVVINTYNEEANIDRVLKSVKWADEVVVCDMHSTDHTVRIAKENNAKVVTFAKKEYVEPARNFAISQTTSDWVLILDADETVPEELVRELKQIAESARVDYVRIPRKNIIFGKWIEHTMWWPDYNIRFFKKGSVTWDDAIHRPPKTSGEGMDIEAKESLALVHHHYQTLTQYLERMIRYSRIQSEELIKSGYQFDWRDLIGKSLSEFLGRYFVNQGYKDGLHGLVLSVLQAFSFLIVYLRIWEHEKFPQQTISPKDLGSQLSDSSKELKHWQTVSFKDQSTLNRLKHWFR